jgi:phosphoribosylformimino-5-aminoimidazole carboxamide ribotide isomerase
MLIIPAIDIKDGKVVRLFQGRFDQVTEYGADPVEMAKHWEGLGAKYLHVVDLDGAVSGERRNQDIIKRIIKAIAIPIETGGGIRSREVVEDFMDAGIGRVILGTKVVDDRELLADVLKRWRARIAVSLDCSKGFVAQRGWVATSTVKGVDMARELAAMGLEYIIYTDIARDGTLAGPNIDGLKEVLETGCPHVIASGGVKSLDDVRALLALKHPSLYGMITGRAVYEGTLDIKEALKLC